MKKIIFFCFCQCWLITQAQKPVSISTDLSFLRSLSKNQDFTVIGQTVKGEYHFTQKETGYAWVSYYSPGTYTNTLEATAKDPATTPASISYNVKSRLRFRQVSLGWKHFFIGGIDSEKSWNLYGSAGFGLMAAKVENLYDPVVDTALYNVAQRAIAGTGDFKRLTFDLGLGAEAALASTVFLYAELRTWLPASTNPSPYMYNDNAPRVAILSGGIRILFD